MSPANPETSAALSLLSAGAVRERAHRMLAIGLDDGLPNFRIQLDRLDDTVDLVLKVTRAAYPSDVIPFHSGDGRNKGARKERITNLHVKLGDHPFHWRRHNPHLLALTRVA